MYVCTLYGISGSLALNTSYKPIEALKHALSLNCSRLLNGPLSVLDLGQLHRLRDLCSVVCSLLILLVSKDEQNGILEFFLLHGDRVQTGWALATWHSGQDFAQECNSTPRRRSRTCCNASSSPGQRATLPRAVRQQVQSQSASKDCMDVGSPGL